MRLQDRVAVITGAAQGIGRAIAERFVPEGAIVLASDAASYMTGQVVFPDGGRLPLMYTVPVVEARP